MAFQALPVARFRSAVEVDLATGPAGPGLAHLPKVFLLPEAPNALSRQPADSGPQTLSFIVVEIDRRPELLFGQTPLSGEQLPGPFNRFGFVIVAEGPVAQHLKERVMVGIPADRLQIVVFAADAQTLLRACGARVGQPFLAKKNVLKLHHAGVGKEQGRVFVRHQRRTLHNRMRLPLEIIQEGSANVVSSHHGSTSSSPRRPIRL